MKELLRFIEDRLPIGRAVQKFLNEPLPLNVGWAHVLGSALLFLLILQFLTGGVLLFFYAPTPQNAWESLNYLISNFQTGSLLHGLHTWGATLIILVTTAHLLRVVWHGSYKKPRELNWLSGMLAFLIILGFSFTGYLLPWDQKGYWGTEVGTKMIEKSPVVGPFLARFLRGGSELGAYTLSRFFALHVFFLPALLVVFAILHLVLLRRHGIAPHPKPSERSNQRLPFYPFQVFRDASAAGILLFVLLVLAALFPAGLEAPADPADITFDPRPEWYFLAHYELLRLFSGWDVVAIVIIPTLILAGLFLLPFWDRGERREWTSRRVPVLLVVGLFAAMYGAVVYSKVYHPAGGITVPAESLPLPEYKDPDLMLLGRKLFVEKRCVRCHQLHGVGGLQGPDLSQTGWKFSEEHLRQQILNPKANNPESRMPSFAEELSDDELKAIVKYLSQML